MAFLRWIWGGIRWLIGLVLPVFSSARQSRAVGAGLRWTLHILLVVAILVGLYFLNRHWKPFLWGRGELQNYWLPILFLLLYAIAWLGLWLWRLLITEPEHPEYADITEAWDEAVAALAKAGLDPRDLPMFLVLGRPEGPIGELFHVPTVQLLMDQTPARPDAPLHVWAVRVETREGPREAIYVSCEGTCLLGHHALQLAFEMPVGGEPDDGGHTLRFGNAPGVVAKVFAMVRRKANREMTPADIRHTRGLMRQDRQSYIPLIRRPDEVARLTSRFEAFCRLLVRDRWPYCPVNGMLILVPFAATESDQDAIDTGDTIHHDLVVARSVLQVDCAKVALVCELETASGFAQFLSGFSEKQQRQRIGQRFPLVPLLDPRNGHGRNSVKAYGDLVDTFAGSICNTVVPGWVYKHFQLETPKKGYHDVLVGNAQLFQFMHQYRERQHRLGVILRRGVTTEGDEPPLLGGCYLAATGSDPARSLAFIAGVFRRLAEEENSVTWTDQALAEEANYQRWIGLGQTVLAVFVVLLLALAGFWILGARH
jgi:hypothetical protein